MKRISSSVAVLAVAAATVSAVAAYAGPQRSSVATVKVTIKNFHFTLSKHSARHGKVKFVVTNKDSIKHDFKIAGKKTPLLGKGQTKSITVTQLGWSRRPPTKASRWKRAPISSWPAKCGCNSFTATGFFRPRCSPRYTAPIAPSPRSSTMR